MSADTRPVPRGLLRGLQSDTFDIRDAAYVPERRELQITFMSGRTFAYSDVPHALYDAFVVSPSRSAFFSIAIRGRFQFRELPRRQPPTRH